MFLPTRYVTMHALSSRWTYAGHGPTQLTSCGPVRPGILGPHSQPMDDSADRVGSRDNSVIGSQVGSAASWCKLGCCLDATILPLANDYLGLP